MKVPFFAVCAFVLALVLGVVGCTKTDGGGGGDATWSNPLASRNLQFASLNSTGQVATAILLDNTSELNLDNVTTTLAGCLNDAKTILNGDVTFANLGPILSSKIPEGRFRAYVTQALILVEGQAVPTEKIGVNNVKRIAEFLNGAIYRAQNYDREARLRELKGEKKLKSSADIELGIVSDFYKKEDTKEVKK